jgi:hypothetical protein
MFCGALLLLAGAMPREAQQQDDPTISDPTKSRVALPTH